MQLSESLAKRCLRECYRAALGAHALVHTSISTQGLDVRTFYGGARSGDIGGPLVKLKRLQAFFPEHRWDYNLVYLLSNAPYLPAFALRLLKRRQVPIVLNQNGVFYPAWYAGDWRAKNSEMARAYHLADYVFWQSEFCRRAADRFLGERGGTGEILYNAVDTERFHPAHSHEDDRPFTFLITGKIDTHLFYRIEASLRGLAEARARGLEVRLTIAGWLSPEAQFMTDELARHLGNAEAVSTIGPYTQEQAPEIYQSADAYLMFKHNDPCPNTVIEALASGLPVLYSDSGGVPELAGPEAGIGLPVEESWDRPHWPDAGAIADAMQTVISNLPAMSAAARNRATERFDSADWIERHRAVFGRLVRDRP